MMKKHIWAVAYTAALLAFTVYIALDTFVITRSYDKNGGEMNTAMFNSLPNNSSESETASSDTSDNSDTSDTPDVSESSAVSDNSSSADSANSRPNKKPGGHENTSSSVSSSAAETSVPISEPEQTAPPEPTPEYSIEAIEKNEYEADYHDENIDIAMMKYRMCDTTIYCAEVTLSSAQYFKTAFAEDTYGRNIKAKTSEIAAAHNAILAINGDYYGARESGCVIRNGIAYRDNTGSSDVLCVYADGRMEIAAPYSISADDLVARGVWQAFSFGPCLVNDGNVNVTVNEEVSIAKADNQRTAVGIIDELHYLLVVTDGRTTESKGLTLYETANFMKAMGAKTAYNLDGGGSSTIVYNGVLLNNPTASGDVIAERRVSDIVYIG